MNLRKAGIAAIGAVALGGGTLALLPGAAGAAKTVTGVPDGSSDSVRARGVLIQSTKSNRFTYIASGSPSRPCTLTSTGDAPVRCVLTAKGTNDGNGHIAGTLHVTSSDGTIDLSFDQTATGCGTEKEGATTTLVSAWGQLGPETVEPPISTLSVSFTAADTDLCTMAG